MNLIGFLNCYSTTRGEKEKEKEKGLSKRKGGEKWSAMDDSEKRKVKGDEKEEEEVQEKVQKIWWGEMKGVLLNRLGEMVQTSSPSCFEESLIMLLRGWIREIKKEFEERRRISQANQRIEIDYWIESVSSLKDDSAFPGCLKQRHKIPVLVARIIGEKRGPKIMISSNVDVPPNLNDSHNTHQQESYGSYSHQNGMRGDERRHKRDMVNSWRVQDGSVYGRGVCDMKGGAATALAVFELFCQNVDSGHFDGELIVIWSGGGVDGGLGALAAIRRGYTADFCIVPKPTAPSLSSFPNIVVTQSGSLNFLLTLKGKKVQGGWRMEGKSAFDSFLEIYHKLRIAESEFNSSKSVRNFFMKRETLPYPINIGIVSGGDWVDHVIDQLTVQVRVGVGVGESLEEAEKRFRRVVAEAVSQSPWLKLNPPEIELIGGKFASSSIDPSHSMIRQLRRSSKKIFGTVAKISGSPSPSEMALWNDVGGVPTVQFGAGVNYLVGPDDHICLDSLNQVFEILVDVVATTLNHTSLQHPTNTPLSESLEDIDDIDEARENGEEESDFDLEEELQKIKQLEEEIQVLENAQLLQENQKEGDIGSSRRDPEMGGMSEEIGPNRKEEPKKREWISIWWDIISF